MIKRLTIIYLFMLPLVVPAVDQLVSVTATNVVYPGATVPVTVEYEAAESRTIAVRFQLNSNPWTGYGSSSVSVTSGTGIVVIELPVSASTPIATNAYKIGVTVEPVGGGWSERLDQFVASQISCFEEPIPETDELVSIDVPEAVRPSTSVPVTVYHNAITNRDVVVNFQLNSNPWTTYGYTRVSVPAGFKHSTVYVDIDANTPEGSGAYKFGVSLQPVGGSWNERLDEIIKSGVDCSALTGLDDQLSLIVPPVITPGSTVPVSVSYVATADRDIQVRLRQASSPWTEYAAETLSVEAGASNVVFSLSVDGSIPLATNAYRVDAGLLPVAGEWADRIAEAMQADVSCENIPHLFTVFPAENTDALVNPLKGFRPNRGNSVINHEYGTLARHYIRWNDVENDESDTVQKIKDYCNEKWAGYEELGIKVIPRVFLDWDSSPSNEYWAADMTTGDYSSTQFTQRLERLIYRLGECWDNDPRVAWVQMGIIGYWGEHHSPSPTPEIQTLMGNAFSNAFSNKKFLVRHYDEFTDYNVGIYWDSWAHIQQINNHGAGIEALNASTGRWMVSPMEGETAYNWGDWQIQPGDDPDDTLTDPVHRDFLLDSIRNLHGTALGWISGYDQESATIAPHAAEVQKTFGYRFVVPQVSWSGRVEPDGILRLAMTVRNTGSAPFYHDWPLEFSLLDPATFAPIWTTLLNEVDIRSWLPGDDWDEDSNVYLTPASNYTVNASIHVPRDRVPSGEYIVAVAVLDPVGLEPALRFAVQNYASGGRHPIGRLGIGTDVAGSHELSAAAFDDPGAEGRLPYALEPPPVSTPVVDFEWAVSNEVVRISGTQSGNSNGMLVVQRTDDLLSGEWEAIQVLSGAQSVFEQTEPIREESTNRFYRVIAVSLSE